jgi:protein-L-isoaspartate(D-aspartate) O-methyltransferase
MRTLSLVLFVSAFAHAEAPSWRPVLREHGIADGRILSAMEKVRRADFLPDDVKAQEFEDHPLLIGYDQTTSQPSLIALMIQVLGLKPGCRVLEVGTGSGYQTALLGELCAEVSSIDIVEPLATRAGKRLSGLGYKNVKVKAGDGYLGWPERAPFDGIVVSAGAPKIPEPLVEQLKPGGKLVIPVGPPEKTRLLIVVKNADGTRTTEESIPVRFVPLTGKNADRDRASLPR